MLSVQVSKHRPDLNAEQAFERDVGGFDEGYLLAKLAGGRRHLRANPTGPDHNDPCRARESLTQRVAARKAPQVVDTLEVGAGNRYMPRSRSGGEQELVVGEASTRIQVDLLGCGVDGRDHRRGKQLDLVLFVEGIQMHRRLLETHLAAATTPLRAADVRRVERLPHR